MWSLREHEQLESRGRYADLAAMPLALVLLRNPDDKLTGLAVRIAMEAKQRPVRCTPVMGLTGIRSDGPCLDLIAGQGTTWRSACSRPSQVWATLPGCSYRRISLRHIYGM
jgi:hypothetical protein